MFCHRMLPERRLDNQLSFSCAQPQSEEESGLGGSLQPEPTQIKLQYVPFWDVADSHLNRSTTVTRTYTLECQEISMKPSKATRRDIRFHTNFSGYPVNISGCLWKKVEKWARFSRDGGSRRPNRSGPCSHTWLAWRSPVLVACARLRRRQSEAF